MCPNEFTKLGGSIFLFLGLLGAVHVLGPTPSNSLFGSEWWLDWREISVLIILGLLSLFSLRFSREGRHLFAIGLGWLFLLASVWGILSDSILGIHIESPMEPLMFFIVGIWAHLAGLCTEKGEHRKMSKY